MHELPLSSQLALAQFTQQGPKLVGYESSTNFCLHAIARNVSMWQSGQQRLRDGGGVAARGAGAAARRVAVIVTAGGTATALAAKAATTTIPIVFAVGGDPVRSGLVASLNRPGGNVTGAASYSELLNLKRLQLARELAPEATVIAFLHNPNNPNFVSEVTNVDEAARAIGRQVRILAAGSAEQFENVFKALVKEKIGALVLADDTIFTNGRKQLVALAARFSVPAIYQFREFTVAGGLVSYGSKRQLSPGWSLCRPHPQRCQACRSSGRRANQVRTRRQPQDRQGARPHHSGNAAGYRRRGDPVKRRTFITGLGSVAAWPVLARAQQPTIPVVGFLGSEWAEVWAGRLRAFRQGLGEIGYVEGKNLAIEYRWAESQNGRLPSLAADLVRRQVSVITAPGSTPAALAAKASTTTIPIVFAIASDAVGIGLVASLSRPGGNLTGVTTLGVEVGPKRLELMRELVPKATVVALLVNPTNPVAETVFKDLQAAARILGQLEVLHASAEYDFEAVFATVVRLRAGGLVIGADPLFSSRSEQLATLALRYAVPTIYQFREFTAAGGLISYGGSDTDQFYVAGLYTGRVLKGEKPADLPVRQSTRIELVINLKTAKALGLTVPETLLATADEVIQ
jgi:putative ABC transport system substrate-binding protein